MTTPLLFTPITLRGTTVRNRLWLAPMCQYSATDGRPNDWHVVHLGARANGGFGLLVTEATAVLPEGRITPFDLGLWDDAQVAPWRRVVQAVHAAGALVAVQLAHAGRKASTDQPWSDRLGTVPAADGGWTPVAPSPLAFPGYDAPRELSTGEISDVVTAFADATRRALAAGVDAVEVHAAHGYLLHQFLSPLTNQRTDAYGGTPVGRARLLREVVAAVREEWPAERPVLVRVSATDWTPGGLKVEDVAAAVAPLHQLGADLIDVSSGGLVPAPVPSGPGYQVPLARRVRELTGMPVSTVGLITSATQAEQALVAGNADAVMIGRPALREPTWGLHAAHELGVPVATDGPVPWPPQYLRAVWAG